MAWIDGWQGTSGMLIVKSSISDITEYIVFLKEHFMKLHTKYFKDIILIFFSC